MAFGLQSGDHRKPAPDSAGHQRPEAYLPKARLLQGQGEEVKEDGGEEERSGKIVQSGVQAGPVVAKHGQSQKREK